MADLGLIIIAVDGLWLKLGRVPDADRVTLLDAAGRGVPVVIVSERPEDELWELRLMLRYDPITVAGPTQRVELKGRLVLDSPAGPDELLDTLTAELGRSPQPFGREHILVIGSRPDDLPLLLAAGTAALVPSGDDDAPLRAVADYLAPAVDAAMPGVARTLLDLVLRNNRFLLPGRGGRSFDLL